jgi:phage regulator Rha-like protein
MSNQLATLTAVQTMSSREIAELVESRHDSVKRTIERLAEKQVIVQPPTVDEPSTDELGRPRTISVYRLDKRSSLIVVAQLCPEFTARVVDRWQQLESTITAPVLPTTYLDALKALVASTEAQQVFVMRLPVDGATRRPAPPSVLCAAYKNSLKEWKVTSSKKSMLRCFAALLHGRINSTICNYCAQGVRCFPLRPVTSGHPSPCQRTVLPAVLMQGSFDLRELEYAP